MALDESMGLEAAQVGVQAGLLAQLLPKIREQGPVGHHRAGALRPRNWALASEHLALELGLPLRHSCGLALPFGQHDHGPQHHQQRDGVARQLDVVVGVQCGLAEHRVVDPAPQRRGDVIGVDVVDEAQADLRQSILHRLPELGVDEGAFDPRMLPGQPAAREELGGEQGRVVVVRHRVGSRWLRSGLR